MAFVTGTKKKKRTGRKKGHAGLPIEGEKSVVTQAPISYKSPYTYSARVNLYKQSSNVGFDWSLCHHKSCKMVLPWKAHALMMLTPSSCLHDHCVLSYAKNLMMIILIKVT